MAATTIEVWPGTPWLLITVICICLFIGAMGKSAQFPLHVWLPDSMEGPTPISALIHAATMVTAGIFMVARMSPLFELSDAALTFVIVIGAITAFFMGLLGIVQNDIKRVVAYSTLSQLGYMTVALGASAYSVAIFHLMTHAFFKALLFLAAGSVIIGMHHEQDIRKMGGLWRKMPVTWITALIGSLALVGTPFFSGFYSKDSIILAAEAAAHAGQPGAAIAHWAVLAGVAVTAFYSFRMFFLVFHGKPRWGHDAHAAGHGHHGHGHDEEHGGEPHESPNVVTVPLVLLAIPSVIIGFVTIGPMLFGPFFGSSIVIDAARHPAMKELAEHFHGATAMALHGFASAPFWLVVGGDRTRGLHVPEAARHPGHAGAALQRCLSAAGEQVLLRPFQRDRVRRRGAAAGFSAVEGRGRAADRRNRDQRQRAAGWLGGDAVAAAAVRLHLSLRVRHDPRAARHGVAVRNVRLLTDSMQTATPWLSMAIWIPIVFGIALLAAGRDRNADVIRSVALVGSLVGLLVTLPLFASFDAAEAGLQFVEKAPWIERFGANYHLGVDGLSVWFVLLTAFMTVVVVLAGWEVIEERVGQYYASFLILSGLMIGVFCAVDGLLFYVFFEATLIPMYIIIGVWGGPKRVYAAFKFFLYTLLGSLLMLVALVYLYYVSGGKFGIFDWHATPLGMTAQILIFLAFLLAFAVKVPMWPVHTWLPDAHVEAPTGGSIVLAAIMLKLGAYGFLRFSLPIVPDASHALSGFIIALSLIAVVYIGFVALVQTDMKKLVAYSSIAHMGFVTLGFFIFNPVGMAGGIVQMISHGFVSGAMFFCIGVMYDRLHSRNIADYGGVVNTMPKFAAFFMLFAMANAGLPATSGFVGEFLVILGAVKFNFLVALAAATTLVLGAAYSLWMYKRVIFGEVANRQVAALTDANGRELLILALLAAAVMWMGLYPKPFTDMMDASVTQLLQQAGQSKLPAGVAAR